MCHMLVSSVNFTGGLYILVWEPNLSYLFILAISTFVSQGNRFWERKKQKTNEKTKTKNHRASETS